ncbi:MAG: DUF421 domain-containing protein [Omnitrophica WOR_2 bacterium]
MNLPLPLFLASVAARTIIILFVLVAGIRIFGKRDVGGMNLIDLILVLLLGNAVQNALTYGSGHIGVGLVSAGTLLLIDQLLGILFVREPWLEVRIFGGPVTIVTDGRLHRRAMVRQGIDEDEVLAAARSIGLHDLDQVHLAVLEDDGTISIIPKERAA